MLGLTRLRETARMLAKRHAASAVRPWSDRRLHVGAAGVDGIPAVGERCGWTCSAMLTWQLLLCRQPSARWLLLALTGLTDWGVCGLAASLTASALAAWDKGTGAACG